jgi:hypothetical protein
MTLFLMTMGIFALWTLGTILVGLAFAWLMKDADSFMFGVIMGHGIGVVVATYMILKKFAEYGIINI